MRLGWLAVLSAAIAGVFIGSFYIAMQVTFAGREVVVPELIGLTVDEARATLNRSELYLEAAAERHDDRVGKGLVRSQDPPAGATIKKSRKVKVSVSLGPLEASIPELRGQRLRTARLALEREGLSVGHVTASHERAAPADSVMSQDPLPEGAEAEGSSGARVSDGGRIAVDLLVSRGPAEALYVMPDLSRRRMEEVSAFARRAGLRLGAVRRERSPGAPRGTVIKHYPPSGHPIGRQDIISLVVSE